MNTIQLAILKILNYNITREQNPALRMPQKMLVHKAVLFLNLQVVFKGK
jgi:hypothetical protein